MHASCHVCVYPCLYGQVIKGCSVGHFEGGASFGRFLCGFKDVCSRVECLVVNGYIKRDTDHPQMLIYVPDPTEGSPRSSAASPQGNEVEVSFKYLIM